MVGETNAAIEGALAAGATDILVNDSHWTMYNLLPEAAPPGGARPPGREGLVDGRRAPTRTRRAPRFDVALFVGYHARAGHPRGTIAHTYSATPGRDAPRRPPDRRVRRQRARPRGVGHPGRAGRRRRRPGRGGRGLAAVGRAGRGQGRGRRPQRDVGPPDRSPATWSGPAPSAAVRRAAAGELRPLGSAPPVVIEVDYARGVHADHAAIVPGAERVGDRGVRYASDDPVTAFRGFLVGNRVAGTVG